AIVNAHGQVVRQTGLFEQTILRADVRTATARTLYVRFGDWFPVACLIVLLILLGVAIAAGVRARRRGAAARPADAGPPAGEGVTPTREPSLSVDPAAPQAGSDAGGFAPASLRSSLVPPWTAIAGGVDSRVLVVLPTYNERATIEAAVRGVLKA